MSFDELPIERALGIHWCVESDQFNFRITLKDQPPTRRGILSTVASMYDPLGFVAPFVLNGKRVLQEMCRQGTGWDDPLSDALRPRWVGGSTGEQPLAFTGFEHSTMLSPPRLRHHKGCRIASLLGREFSRLRTVHLPAVERRQRSGALLLGYGQVACCTYESNNHP